MKRLLAAMCVGLIASTAPAEDLPDEGAWINPVTLWERYVYVPRAIERLAKDAELPLVAAPAFNGRKLMAFAKDRPLRDMLAAIADAFAAEWKVDSKGAWRLTIPKERLEAELALLKSDTGIEKELRRRMDIAAKDFIELQDERAAARAELDSLRTGRDSASVERARELNAFLYEETAFASSLMDYLVARTLRGFSAGEWEALWEGRIFFYGTREGAARQLPSIVRSWAERELEMRKSGGFEIEHVSLGFFIRRDTGEFVASCQIAGRGGALGTSGNTLAQRQANAATDKITAMDKAWAHHVSSPAFALGLDGGAWNAEPLRLEPMKNPSPLPPGHTYTRSEAFEWIAQRSGAAVVGEAFRTPLLEVSWPERTPTIEGALSYLGGAVRYESGWLKVRTFGGPLLRRSEPDENALRAYETRAPSVESAAAFAASGNAWVAQRLRDSRIGGRIENQPIASNWAFLRLWHKLSPAQRQATKGAGLLYGDLDASLRPSWEAMIWEAEAQAAMMPDPLGRRPTTPGDAALGPLVRREDRYVRWIARSGSGEIFEFERAVVEQRAATAWPGQEYALFRRTLTYEFFDIGPRGRPVATFSFCWQTEESVEKPGKS